MGIHILNYLDDCLILAQSDAEPLSHRSLLLSHLECLGLRVNFAKTALSPSQIISFLGAVFDSALMASASPVLQLGLHGSSGPLERPSVDGTGHSSGNGLQKKGCLDRCVQHRLGSSVWWQTDFQPLVERGKSVTHQLPGNAGSVSGPSYLLARPKGTPRSGPLGQHDGGVLYKSPGRAHLEAPLLPSTPPLGMGTA